MSSANIKDLQPAINKVFEDIRSHIAGIEKTEAQPDFVIKGICDYVTVTLTAESKALLSSFYSKLEKETLSSEPFLTARNQNKFYDKDIRGVIFGRYSFSVEKTIDYQRANEHCASLPMPAGAAGIGVILAVALSVPVIVPVSLAVAGGLYYCILQYEKDKNKNGFLRAINEYIDSLKIELIRWFEAIENFYNEQVEELKKDLGD